MRRAMSLSPVLIMCDNLRSRIHNARAIFHPLITAVQAKYRWMLSQIPSRARVREHVKSIFCAIDSCVVR